MALPPNFGYIWKRQVAGSAHPGSGRRLAESLASLRQAGIEAVLTLTEEPLEFATIREFDIDYLHLPIDDFSAPNGSQVAEAMQFIRERLAGGKGVLVHCRAGVGRTGTILACFLVDQGVDADQAIREIRRLRPGSVEVYAQEFCVYQYAQQMNRRTPPGESS